MSINLITTRQPSTFSSVLNGLVTGAFTFAIVAGAGFLTFAQYIAIA